MLNCEKETKAMGRRVLAAAKAYFRKNEPWRKTRQMSSWFEHGQWWIVHPNGGQWAVTDAEGLGTEDGFDFEHVSYGYEE